MSISLVLVPLAIALSVTLKDGSLKKIQEQRPVGQYQRLPEKLESMQTKFTSQELLIKTLQEHGFTVSVLSENHVAVKAGKAELSYERDHSKEAFSVSAHGWDNFDGLVDCLEKEYRSNVQSYTYDRLMENLSESGMTVGEETILPDNSILLTINIENEYAFGKRDG